MDIDVSKLSPTGRAWYERLDAALREEIGGRLPGHLTADDAHAAAFIAVQAADEVMRERIDAEVAKWVKDDPAQAVAEELFDWAHEGCDDEDGCTGGGRPWYDGPAKRLTDPTSGVVAIALTQQMMIDRLGTFGPTSPTSASWIAGLQNGLSDLCAAGNPESARELWQLIADLGAWCARWLDAIVAYGDEGRAAVAARNAPEVATDVG